MHIERLEQFTKGWVVGDFEPSIIRTSDVEVSVRYYKAGDSEAEHVHKIAKEITIVVSGVFEMNGVVLEAGDIVTLEPGESAAFKCIEDGANTVIKMPSVIGDKYFVN